MLSPMRFLYAIFTALFGCMLWSCDRPPQSSMQPLGLHKGERVVLIGNNLGSRMMEFGSFDLELHMRYADSTVFIRNMCFPGYTAGFRPHPSRNSPWAFPGAEAFNSQFAVETGSEGHFPTDDEWLQELKPDVILAFFGYNESFGGPEKLDDFRGELAAFIEHSRQQSYNSEGHTQLVLISPIAFEDLSDRYDLPDGKEINTNLALYTQAMQEVAAEKDVPFLDVFTITQYWYKNQSEPMTIDGSQLSKSGYDQFASYLVEQIFGKGEKGEPALREGLRQAVLEKDWIWRQDYKIPNGVHAYGRRFNPFGPDNYPFEIQKLREMGYNRDTAIWLASKGQLVDLKKMDSATSKLPEVETNYEFQEGETGRYLYGEEAVASLHTAPGYKIDLFASEEDFPDLANPVQIAFDSKGRLWVATMPSYPHWKAGDGRPNDKVIILEDIDGDGKADTQTVFADSLHLPTGIAFTPDGVYISQGRDLVLLNDTDGDGKADRKEIVLTGFDDHDTHHAHSTYSMDPSGAFYMAEGLFLHSNVETSYGPIRGVNGGFYRYQPQTKKLERVAQVSIPNPWGIATDAWNQTIYSETSGPDVRWMLPGSLQTQYGQANPKGFSLVDPDHRVRPTSGLEIVSSRHFPDEVQGDFLINNTIGFLGTKQHTLVDSGTGFVSEHRQDLLWGDDKNFRPVDLEFAPDGSLYLVDWHNLLIGHMQHNARDPLRDHMHGRIYRITYPSRPLVKPAKIDGATIDELLENLKLPENRTRERTRTELRMRDADEVLRAVKSWAKQLDSTDSNYLKYTTEAMWVTWGANQIDESLLKQLLQSTDHRARSAAVRALRYNVDKLADHEDLFLAAASDSHGRVLLEVIAAATWLKPEIGQHVLSRIDTTVLDEWNAPSYRAALAYVEGRSPNEEKAASLDTDLTGPALEQYKRGATIYARDGYCVTCHQPDGKGLDASGFPPLDASRWVTGSEERLIKLTLNGLLGPIQVKGKNYPGQVPMTPFGALLDDQEMADVLTYVRNSFGNKASAISAEQVKTIRAAIAEHKGFYSPDDLLKIHPLEN